MTTDKNEYEKQSVTGCW